MNARHAPIARLRLGVHGGVQGVGFRPFVYRLAHELALRGWVRNRGAGVEIEIQGVAAALEVFVERLRREAPRAARIAAIEQTRLTADSAAETFEIAASRAGEAGGHAAPDLAVCDACLAQLFDPADRRYRYPFINCTQCGPRYSLIRALPYDRARTSMAAFSLCAECAREYTDPADRRFHAEPNACARCGPRLRLHDGAGAQIEVEDVIAAALAEIRAGRILAMKGVGGFHLLCDARNTDTVARLRARKHRPDKPLALMALNLASMAPYLRATPEECAQLQSSARPIVLLRKREGCDAHFPAIAPAMAELGVMLPYTPLHYLLFHEAAGRPSGTGWLNDAHAQVLVCTSANRGGEPVLIDDAAALRELRGIADAFLAHDRAILRRADDGVRRGGLSLRRARGEAPRPLKLARGGPSVLALGAYLKNTLCLTRDDEAFVSPHIGDLDNAAACRAMAEMIDDMSGLLDIRPRRLAHDLHPDFPSSRAARAYAAERGLPCLAVQHHHAHIAAVMAEHGVCEAVLGLALDGSGLGTDGTLWGGEVLRVAGAAMRRVSHLRPLPMPGGERAAREPWRMAAAVLHELGRDAEIVRRYPGAAGETLAAMLGENAHCPPSTSMGRWFDAAAALLGVCEGMNYEGQAAMRLEALATAHGPFANPPRAYGIEGEVLDLLPLMSCLGVEKDPARGAALFHAVLIAALDEWLMRCAEREAVHVLVLGGGCFVNTLLREGLRDRLGARGMRVYTARALPCGDGGVSLGQAWVAMMAEV